MAQTPGSYTEPPQPRPSIIVAMIAGVVAAILGPLLWYGMYKTMNNALLPPLMIGVGVGLAMRLVGQSSDRRLSIVAAVLTVLAGAAGYVWTDMALVPWIQPPTLGGAITHLLNDLMSLILIAFGAYLAFIIATRSPAAGAR